jgi:hypothetical protein
MAGTGWTSACTANAIRPLAARGAQVISRRWRSKPDDVAVLVTYLASEQAGHINGRIFEVWHGHIGIFVEPPPVQEVIKQQDSFTLDELAQIIPEKLTKGLSATEFSPIMSFGRRD